MLHGFIFPTVATVPPVPDPNGHEVHDVRKQEAQKPLAEQRPLPVRPERLNAILMGQKCPVQFFFLRERTCEGRT